MEKLFSWFADPKRKKLRKGLMFSITLLCFILSACMLFMPFLLIPLDNGGTHVSMPINIFLSGITSFSQLNTKLIISLATAVYVLVLVVINAVILLRQILTFYQEEEKFIKKTARSSGVLLAFTAFYALIGLVVCMIVNLFQLGWGTTLSYIGVIISLVIALFCSFMEGVLKYAKTTQESDEDKENPERVSLKKKNKRAKIELFCYLILAIALTAGAYLTKIIDAKIVSGEYEFNTISITGTEILANYSRYTSTEQLFPFFIIMVLSALAIFLVLSITALISKSKIYPKLSLTGIFVSVFFCAFVGVFGVYYQIVQTINIQSIYSLIEGTTGLVLEEGLSVSVVSFPLYYFIAQVVVLILFIVRRPYSKVLETQSKLDEALKTEVAEGEIDVAIKEMPEGMETNSESVEEIKKVDYDPCPIFSEIDEKVSSMQENLQEKKKSLFISPSLPKLVDFIVDYAKNSRLHLSYTREDIATFIAGLGTTKLTILQGMSGTGKTSLPKIFTEALMAQCDIIEVESSWRDKNELLGYYNEFSKIYTPKKFTQALYRAKLNPETLTLIVLDEMNLSRIEYYFSDFLSLMENEPENRILNLANVKLEKVMGEEKIAYAGIEEDGYTIKVPKNVWFVGTANRDESTFEISDKVYDRAHTMNFNKRAKKITEFDKPLSQQYLPADVLDKLFEDAKKDFSFNIDDYKIIGEVEQLTIPYNISFGNRIAMQIENFVSVYCACFEKSDEIIHQAVETILLSKVVAKLELKSVENKEKLAKEFEKLGLNRCRDFILSLNED